MQHLLIYSKESAEHYGIDWDGPLPQEYQDADQVDVPQSQCPLTEDQYDQLQSNVSPLAESSNYGIDLFLECVSFVENIMMS